MGLTRGVGIGSVGVLGNALQGSRSDLTPIDVPFGGHWL